MELLKLVGTVNGGAGGVILRKQTTYLDIAANSDVYRINYRGKREFELTRDRFEKISVHAEHPLLMDYLEPMIPVHLGSAVDDKSGFRELLEDVTTEVLGKWRSIERYLNLPLERFLEKPYGLLMTGPETLAKLAAERAEKSDVRLILHDGYRHNGDPKVLIMDTDFVIADGFLVELLSPVEKLNA